MLEICANILCIKNVFNAAVFTKDVSFIDFFSPTLLSRVVGLKVVGMQLPWIVKEDMLWVSVTQEVASDKVRWRKMVCYSDKKRYFSNPNKQI